MASHLSNKLIAGWLAQERPLHYQSDRAGEWIRTEIWPEGKGNGKATSYAGIQRRMRSLGHDIARTTLNKLGNTDDGSGKALEPSTVKAIAAYTRPSGVDFQDWLDKTSHWLGLPTPETSKFNYIIDSN